MGRMYSWHCEDCGAGESFCCGGGMMSFNDPAVVEESGNGSLGPAMKRLLGEGVPEGWFVFSSNEFYRCPNCGNVIEKRGLRIEDGGSGWLDYHVKPYTCGSCGEELAFWDDMVPMTEDELWLRCEGYATNGCPVCTSKNVTIDAGLWD